MARDSTNIQPFLCGGRGCTCVRSTAPPLTEGNQADLTATLKDNEDVVFQWCMLTDDGNATIPPGATACVIQQTLQSVDTVQ